jgi:hypothetical protein
MNEENENSAQINQVSAQETAPAPKKKVVGRPITKETAKQYQLSAAAAKKRRKEERAKMLNVLTTQLDLGDELVKAFRSGDERRINIIDKALKIVGLRFEDSDPEAVQNVNVNAKTENKTSMKGTIEFVLPNADK